MKTSMTFQDFQESSLFTHTMEKNALEMLKIEARAENYFLSSCLYEMNCESALLSCDHRQSGHNNQ